VVRALLVAAVAGVDPEVASAATVGLEVAAAPVAAAARRM